MTRLTRQQLIERIESSDGSDLDALARWAFDQFYAEEEGSVDFEPGYRHAIGAVLDELMFADEPSFRLGRGTLRALADGLRSAEPRSADENDEDDEDEDET